MTFNFEGVDLGELFAIPKDRTLVLASKIADTVTAIVADPTSCVCDCENCKKMNNGTSIHRGKVLKKLLNEIDNEGEQFFMVNRLDQACDLIESEVRKKQLRDALKGGLDKIFDIILK